MKLHSIQLSDNHNQKGFGSTRVLKNTVNQLAHNNKYSLNEPNSRFIKNSIAELGNSTGKKVVEFLVSVAEKLKYSTNIKLTDNPINDWKTIILDTAEKVLLKTPSADYKGFSEKIQKLRENKDLNKTEKEILNLRDNLIEAVNIRQIKKETVGGIKDFKRNLDYFIVSSETTLEHKKYVLERLNYLMSDDYKINEQLKAQIKNICPILIKGALIC